MAVTQVEFAVPMTCGKCEEKVKQVLKDVQGVQKVQVDLNEERVVVESSLSIFKLQSLLEEGTGKRAIIKGVGTKPLSSAVAVLGYPVGFTTGGVRGVVRFTQLDEECVIDGTIDGLQSGPHGFHIHTSGDLSQGCNSLGEHYNPYGSPHGGPDDDIHNRHLGDLGNIIADEKGRADFRIIDKLVKIQDMIGRSLAVTSQPDDLGRGTDPTTKTDGNSGESIGCGIIARSAGVFQNPKKVCLCNGQTLWEEADLMTAPPQR